MWNTHRQTDAFVDGKPWLLRFFDQVRFFPVSHEELTEWRRDFPLGRREIRIEHETFKLSEYRRFLADNADSIEAFQGQREAAFAAERADWQERGEFDRVEALADSGLDAGAQVEVVIPEGSEVVEAPLGGSVWKMLVQSGDHVEKGAVIAVIEAMKTECDVHSPSAGVVRQVYAQERQSVAAGAPMIALEPA